MARIDIAHIRLVREDSPGSDRVGMKPYEVTPKFPTPLAEHFADSFSQMQLQLGVALNASKQFPYFRAVLAEKILCDMEDYFEHNSVRSDALGVFLSLALIRIAGRDRYMEDLVWKDLTISVHYDELPNDDAAPHALPGNIKEKLPILEDVRTAIQKLHKMIEKTNGGDETDKSDKVLP